MLASWAACVDSDVFVAHLIVKPVLLPYGKFVAAFVDMDATCFPPITKLVLFHTRDFACIAVFEST